jgi:hypothetical protein
LTTEKQCSKCGEVKALELFKNERNQCKACTNAYNKAYREANHEQIKAQSKAYREANPEKNKARLKIWRDTNIEKIKAYNKSLGMTRHIAYRKANPEKIKAYQKSYHKAHPGRRNAHNKATREKLKDVYIITLLGLSKAQATPELIELKRNQLELIRDIRIFTNELKKHTTNEQ